MEPGLTFCRFTLNNLLSGDDQSRIRTAPYMHDGSLATLDDVIEFYSEGGRPNPVSLSVITPRNLAAEEQLALVSFLKTLTGQVQEGVR